MGSHTNWLSAGTDCIQTDLSSMNLGRNRHLLRVKLSWLRITGKTVANTLHGKPGGSARGRPGDVKLAEAGGAPLQGSLKPSEQAEL